MQISVTSYRIREYTVEFFLSLDTGAEKERDVPLRMVSIIR
jgi:hypothetical protein